MKRITLLFMLSCSIIVQEARAGKDYKIEEYANKGITRLSFKHINKYTQQKEKYALISFSTPEEKEALMKIRSIKEVYENYADHKKPETQAVENFFNTLMKRTNEESGSVFPFVLKKVVKTEEGKSYETLGLINVGFGFENKDRMFGCFTDPGALLNEEERKRQNRPEGQIHYQNWGGGVGAKAVKVAAHFTMQFHENGPKDLIVGSIQEAVPIQRTRFSGALTATCDPDNRRGASPLRKAGLRKLSEEEIAARGFTERVKTTYETKKDYYEMTWGEFQKQESHH